MQIEASGSEALGNGKEPRHSLPAVRERLPPPRRSLAGVIRPAFSGQLTDNLVSRLGRRELRRRVWHMIPGFFPFLMLLLPHPDPLSWWWRASFVVDALCLTAACIYWHSTIRRPDEENCFACTLGYAAPVLATLLFFPAHVELGMTVLVIIAFGDGSATLVGMLMRGPALPWNANKTWPGSLAFVVFAMPMAALVYWAEAVPTVPFSTALLCGGTATVAAALAESAPLRWNDNVFVGLAAAATLALIHVFILGW